MIIMKKDKEDWETRKEEFNREYKLIEEQYIERLEREEGERLNG